MKADKQALAEKAFRLQSEGKTIREIADNLDIAKSTLFDLLKAAKVEFGQGSAPFDRLNNKGVFISGAEGYRITEEGIAWKNGKLAKIEEIGIWRANKHKHGHKFRTRAELAIDLGRDYSGPVRPIGRTVDTDHWGRPKRPHREALLRPLDEVVAYEFLPHPRVYVGLTLAHLDGDVQNCAAENLQWFGEPEDDMHTAWLMQPRDRTGRSFRGRIGIETTSLGTRCDQLNRAALTTPTSPERYM